MRQWTRGILARDYRRVSASGYRRWAFYGLVGVHSEDDFRQTYSGGSVNSKLLSHSLGVTAYLYLCRFAAGPSASSTARPSSCSLSRTHFCASWRRIFSPTRTASAFPALPAGFSRSLRNRSSSSVVLNCDSLSLNAFNTLARKTLSRSSELESFSPMPLGSTFRRAFRNALTCSASSSGSPWNSRVLSTCPFESGSSLPHSITKPSSTSSRSAFFSCVQLACEAPLKLP